jgi:protoporphyrinogen oxidase
MSEHTDKKVIIIGGGPAGLTAAYELCKAGLKSIVLEKDNIVGGISRTVDYKGYHFDIGGHRFFTRIKAIDRLWHEILGNDLLRCKRLSRIYYHKRFFYYPLRPINLISGLGIWNSFLIFMSYVSAHFSPEKPERTFEQWVTNRFGKRLYHIFFKSYTEKVWGMQCSQISSDWAVQRINGLSFITAVKNAFTRKRTDNNGAEIKTLIDAFDYPKKGPGMMWEAVADIVQQKGSTLCLGAETEKIYWTQKGVQSVGVNVNGRHEVVRGTHVISSMPIRELIESFEPAVPDDVMQAARSLNYRDFLTVSLIVNKRDIFKDNWVYIHDPQVTVGRIQNFKNWSSHMVPDPNKTCLGLEYFCFEGDELWSMPDHRLIELGKRELEVLGLVKAPEVEDGRVVRMPKAYPVYDSTYQEALKVIKHFISQLDNLQLVGRNGLHKYNNQDHSMLTAMLAVKNISGKNYDLWSVNTDQNYLEDIEYY